MNSHPCAEIYAELEELILAAPSQLCWTVARELADYTVAFVVDTDTVMRPAGVGTLVSFNGVNYILTAAHVWETLSRKELIRIPLRESASRFAIRSREIVPFLIKADEWNEWGPDLALLRIPPERVDSFTAVGRSFFSMSRKKARQISCGIETWFLMGAPAECGEFAADHAVPDLHGMNVIIENHSFCSLQALPMFRSEFDFVCIAIDTTQPSVAKNFQGVSGGGLWRVYIYKDADTGEFQSFKSLSGMAFWQEPIVSGLRVRCHGPQSIGSMLRLLLDVRSEVQP